MSSKRQRLAVQALALIDKALIKDRADDARDIAQLVKHLEKILQKAVASEKKALPIENYPLTWVKLDRYVELSGDTVDAVQARRKAGKWLDGSECKLADGRLWINLPAVDEWVEEWDQGSPSAASRRASAKR
ncbi:hypothetical protein DUGA6_26530 [Duganella sp. HH105]|nr:hypothetical protein DUGA6_26530 [Duganella sp. HH105]